MRNSLVALLLVLGGVSPLEGQAMQNLRINGFGGWSYGRTDQNRFLGYEPNGEYTKSQFALKATATGIPSVQINAQLFFRTGQDGSVARLDYAFADWTLSNAVHLRFGKAKHPFGIYSEVAGLGTVRPFLNLPQSIYGPIALASRAYNGVGLQGDLSLGKDWSLVYDIYGGGIEFEQEESSLLLAQPGVDTVLAATSPFESEDVFGARVQLGLPVDGLRAGASFYSGRPDLPAESEPLRFWTWGVQAEYLTDRTWVRSEYVLQRDRLGGFDDRWVGYYVEAARFLTKEVQLAAMRSVLDVEADPGFPLPTDLSRHEEWAVGLNYWISPEFAVKSSIHWAQGNVLAELDSPTAYITAILLGRTATPNTRLLQFGAQFSF